MTSVRRRLERQQRKKQGAAGTRGQPSKLTEIELRELQAILGRAKAGPLGDAEVDKLKAAMDTLAFLTRELETKGTSIQRLRRMLFGASTEKTSQVVGSKQGGATAQAATADASSSAPSDVAQEWNVTQSSGARYPSMQEQIHCGDAFPATGATGLLRLRGGAARTRLKNLGTRHYAMTRAVRRVRSKTHHESPPPEYKR